MEIQPLETSEETQAKTHEVSALQPIVESESQARHPQREMSNSERWLLGHPLKLWPLRPKTAQETDRLQQMDIDEVLTILREMGQKRARRRRNERALNLGMFVVSLLLVKFAHNFYLIGHFWIPYVVTWVMGVGVMASQQEKEATLAIACFDDVRAVGPLAEALRFKDKPVRGIAAQALIRLLPRVQASDAFLLSPAQRSSLNKALQGRNAELMLAILKAWEQVGDAGALDDVQNLAEGRGEGGRVPKVVRAAQECLPALRQSAGRVQIGAQLLRPANGNAMPSDSLLRPALPHTSADPPEQLLRPTDAA